MNIKIYVDDDHRENFFKRVERKKTAEEIVEELK